MISSVDDVGVRRRPWCGDAYLTGRPPVGVSLAALSIFLRTPPVGEYLVLGLEGNKQTTGFLVGTNKCV